METLMIFVLLASVASTVFFGITSLGDKKNIKKFLISILAVIISLVITVIVANDKAKHYKNNNQTDEVVDKPKASFKMLGNNKLINYWHNTSVEVNKGNTFVDDQMTADTDDNGHVTFQMQTRNKNDVDVQEGNAKNIITTKDGKSTINFNLNGNQKSQKIILDISEKGKDDRTIEFVANNNSKEYLNNKKNKDEKQNKENKELEKEDRKNFDSYDTGNLKKKNEKNNLKDYKNDLKNLPNATKGAIKDAYVDENGTEQTVAVLSDEASEVGSEGLKSVSKQAYDTINSYVQTYKPFPDESLANMIRIEDSSGNLVAKTSWGNYKFVG